MALNFPINPTVGQVYESDLRQWQWTGIVWQAKNPSTGPTGPQGVIGATGPTGPTGSMTLSTTVVNNSTYTVQLADVDKMVQVAAECTVRVPLASEVNFPIGTTINLLQKGSGTLFVAANSGVTLRCASAARTRTQYSALSLIKLDTNEWLLIGDLLA